MKRVVGNIFVENNVAGCEKMVSCNGTNMISADKGRFGSFMKLCDFILLFMTLQVELRLYKRIISETQTS